MSIDRRSIDHDATRLLRTIKRALEACEEPVRLRLPYADVTTDGTGQAYDIDLLILVTPQKDAPGAGEP